MPRKHFRRTIIPDRPELPAPSLLRYPDRHVHVPISIADHDLHTPNFPSYRPDSRHHASVSWIPAESTLNVAASSNSIDHVSGLQSLWNVTRVACERNHRCCSVDHTRLQHRPRRRRVAQRSLSHSVERVSKALQISAVASKAIAEVVSPMTFKENISSIQHYMYLCSSMKFCMFENDHVSTKFKTLLHTFQDLNLIRLSGRHGIISKRTHSLRTVISVESRPTNTAIYSCHDPKSSRMSFPEKDFLRLSRDSKFDATPLHTNPVDILDTSSFHTQIHANCRKYSACISITCTSLNTLLLWSEPSVCENVPRYVR